MKKAAFISAALLALAVLAVQTLAAGPVMLVSANGGVLDAEGRALADYAYLHPGNCYRLMPGAEANLASPDGSVVYDAFGPGRLCLGSDGSLTLNGRELARRGNGPKPISAPERDGMPGPPGAGSLMGKGSRPAGADTASCLALVVGCDGHGGPGVPSGKMAHAVRAAEHLGRLGWQVKLLRNPGWDNLRRALNRFALGSRAKARVFWFSGKGIYRQGGAKGPGLYLALAGTSAGDGGGAPQNAVAFSEMDKMMSLTKGTPLALVLDLSGAKSSLASSDPGENHHLALVGQDRANLEEILALTKFPGAGEQSLGQLLDGLCAASGPSGQKADSRAKPVQAPTAPDESSPQDITAGLFREEKPRPPSGKADLDPALRAVKAWRKAWQGGGRDALALCLAPQAGINLPIPGVSSPETLAASLSGGQGEEAWQRLDLGPPELFPENGRMTVRSRVILLPPGRLWGHRLVEDLTLELHGHRWLISGVSAR